MSPLTRRSVRRALPPYELVPRVAAIHPGARVHALDACGAEGWGTPPRGAGPGRSLLAIEPDAEFRGGRSALAQARHWLSGHRASQPLAAFVLGSLDYDLGREFERIPSILRADASDPPVYLAAFRAGYSFEPASGAGEVIGDDPRAVTRLAEVIDAAGELPESQLPKSPQLAAAHPLTSDADFCASVTAIRDWIRRGDVYQVNLSRRLEIAGVAQSAAPGLYAELTAQTGAPFSAYLDAGDRRVVSNSPERFMRVEGVRVETCPIKGTRARGRGAAEDRWLAKQLMESPKDLAEHVMIVDLQRNDLGRVCRTGSIRVARFAELRSFATVHHRVSSIQGELIDPGDWIGWLSATFPGGSITGAPKLRAMEIIEELEPVRRGLYTGAIACFDAVGGADLSIAIRTAVLRRGQLQLALGGGIVWDSTPEDELRETQEKGRAFARHWAS